MMKTRIILKLVLKATCSHHIKINYLDILYLIACLFFSRKWVPWALKHDFTAVVQLGKFRRQHIMTVNIQ